MGFYPVDFRNPANKLSDDWQYLNNQPNVADRSKPVTDVLEAKAGLKEMKIRSPDKLILGYVNINSIRNKFDSLIYMLDKNVDIFLISETKLDDSFPQAHYYYYYYCYFYSFKKK